MKGSNKQKMTTGQYISAFGATKELEDDTVRWISTAIAKEHLQRKNIHIYPQPHNIWTQYWRNYVPFASKGD